MLESVRFREPRVRPWRSDRGADARDVRVQRRSIGAPEIFLIIARAPRARAAARRRWRTSTLAGRFGLRDDDAVACASNERAELRLELRRVDLASASAIACECAELGHVIRRRRHENDHVRELALVVFDRAQHTLADRLRVSPDEIA